MAALEIAKQVEHCVLFTNGSIRIDFAIGSYPHLDVKWAQDDPDKPKDQQPPKKYSLKLLLPKKTHGAAYELIEEHIKSLEKESKLRISMDDWFLRDGDRGSKDEEKGRWTVNTSEERNVVLRDKNNHILRDQKGELVGVDDTAAIKEIFYPGCVVSGLIRPWVQNNKFGKKVNAGLVAVKFMKDGERLGSEQMTDEGAWGEGESNPMDDDDEM